MDLQSSTPTPLPFVPSRHRKDKLYESVFIGPEKDQPDLVDAALLRVSSPRQEREGFGLEAQWDTILSRMTAEYVDKLGLRVLVHVYRDVQQRDAVMANRPMFRQLCDDVPKRGIRTVWCVRIDRFEGDGGETYVYNKKTLEYLGARLFHTELTRAPLEPADRYEGLIGYIKADDAKDEKYKIVDRTTGGRAQRVKRGMTPGANDCFGLRWVSQTVDDKVYRRHHQAPHPTERVIVRDIFVLYRDVCPNLRRLADLCNANGWVSPSGGKWSASTVGWLLRNEAYIGVGYKNKTHPVKHIRLPKSDWVVVPGAIRPDKDGANVVEDDLFHSVQAMLSRRSTGGHPRKTSAVYLLGGGHCRCGQCGLTMTGNERGENDRCAGLRQYVCRNKQVDSPCYHGTGPSVGADKVEQVAWSALVALASDPARVRASIGRLLGEAGPSPEVEQAQVDAIAETEREMKNWQVALGKLDPDLQDGTLALINAGAVKVRGIKAAMAREHARSAATRGELVELEAWLTDLQALGGRLDEADALFGVDHAARRDLLARFKIVVWVRKAGDRRGRFSVRAHVPLPASARLTEEEAGGEELRWEPTNGSCSVGRFPPQPPRAHRHDPLDLNGCFPIDLSTFVTPTVNDRSFA